MTHVFAETETGTSENSLMDAIGDAIHAGMADVEDKRFNADHLCSIFIAIMGYEFDGKKYRVKLKVIIVDHSLAHDDYEDHVKQEHEKQEEAKSMMGAYYAATLYGHGMSSHQRHALSHEMNHIFHDRHGINHIEDIHVVAPDAIHHQLSAELGYDMTPMSQNFAHKNGLGELTLGPGSSGHHTDDKE